MAVFYHQEPNLYLASSSLLFCIPLSIAVKVGRAWTIYTLTALVPASLAYHITKHPKLYALDQAAVFALVLCSWYDGYYGGSGPMILAFAVNVLCFYLYMWGRLTQSLIWSPDYRVATASHVLLHAVSALGYTALLLV